MWFPHLALRPAACALLLLTGCAGHGHAFDGPGAASSCRSVLENIDQVITGSEARDASVSPIIGFPQLRVDRFLASFAADGLAGEAYAFWLELLKQRGTEARRLELRNLPRKDTRLIEGWFSPRTRPEAIAEHCARVLTRSDLASFRRREALARRLRVPDAYDDTSRILGLYPLTRIPFLAGVFDLHARLRATFAEPPEPRARLIRYAPPPPASSDRHQAGASLELAARNPLGIPLPGKAALDHLFDAFAPVWEVESADDRDRVGQVGLDAAGRPRIRVDAPAVYRLVSHTRYGGRVLLQLNYMVWFAARAPEHALDIYAGALDGLIWRVTLSPDGMPIAYDSIHQCGCYYHLFPGEGYRAAQPDDGGEPVFSPHPVRLPDGSERLTIRLAARTHFIRSVRAEPPGDALTHAWRDYGELLSLPWTGGRRSLFNARGFVAGSERTERFLFWPMGIANAGAMRQWGTHAIAFVGRRHFDDARLLEKLLRPIE